MLNEVEIIPVLHKVTGAGHSCKGGGGPGGVDIGGGGGRSVRDQCCDIYIYISLNIYIYL